MIARVGLIIPSSNRMVEQEMVHAFPPGVQAHVARLRMTGAHHGDLASLLPRIEEATRTLLDARCDAVAFHCTATSMEEGPEGDARILAALARAGASRALTTASAIRQAFDALGARRIVLVTPYDAATTEGEVSFLRSAGYEVVHAVGHTLGGSDQYCATPSRFWRERTLEAARRDADGYLISCANISVFGVIEELEQQLGRPVVTSNQAVLWGALRALGWRDVRGCPGRLFARLAMAQPEPVVQTD
jgi:maleate cis-trans isomerase